MCNCLNEKAEEMRTIMGYEYVEPPVEYLSGRAYLSFSVIEPGKKKSKELPLLLTRCPICGEEYKREGE